MHCVGLEGQDHLFSRGERVFEVEGVWDIIVVGGVGGGHASEFISDSDLVELLIVAVWQRSAM